MREYNYYVYIMASKSGVLYIGVTNDLSRRVVEHRKGLLNGFSKKYKTHKLVYFEHTNDINTAIEREKQIKKWRREKKINLIRTQNQNFIDLSKEFSL